MSYAQRAMDLDKLTAPDGHVLTGVKLRSIGGHLNLEIQVTHLLNHVVTCFFCWYAYVKNKAT